MTRPPWGRLVSTPLSLLQRRTPPNAPCPIIPTIPGAEDGTEALSVTHAAPPGLAGRTPCCGLTPFELPLTDMMTLTDSEVDCPGGGTDAT